MEVTGFDSIHIPQTQLEIRKAPFFAGATLSWRPAEANGLLINLNKMTLRRDKGRLLSAVAPRGQKHPVSFETYTNVREAQTNELVFTSACPLALRFHTNEETHCITCARMEPRPSGIHLHLLPSRAALRSSITHADAFRCSSVNLSAV